MNKSSRGRLVGKDILGRRNSMGKGTLVIVTE